MYHKAPVFAKKHIYIVPSYRKTTFFKNILQLLLKNPFQQISDKNCETRLPSPLIKCWLQIGCSFLVFTALYAYFSLGTTLSQGEGGLWVTLNKSNVFLWTFL